MRAWSRYHIGASIPQGYIVLTQLHGTRLLVAAEAIYSLREGKDGTFITLRANDKETRFWAKESKEEIKRLQRWAWGD